MFYNYLKVALRNIARHKGYSFINIAGLAIGMACCILIMLWVQDELSFDRFHDNADRLYRVTESWHYEDMTLYSAETPVPLADAIKDGVPEVVHTTRFNIEGPQLIKYGDKKFQDDILVLADVDFFEMFTFPFVIGSGQIAFADIFSVVITEEMSRKYFGENNPIGQTLNIDRRDFTVSGVIQNIPFNSHIKFDCIVPFDSRPDWLREMVDKWTVSAYNTYVLLHPQSSVEETIRKIYSVATLHNDEDHSVEYGLQPITRIHLYKDVEDYLEGHGNIKYVYLFSLLALIILLIACINFTNLSTARSHARAREVGMRKIVGARRLDIIKQFYGESIATSIIALIGAVVLVEILIPSFNLWSGKELHLDIFRNGPMLLGIILITLSAGIISGSYSALYISSCQPAKILKGMLNLKGAGTNFRRAMVVFQFAISITLIICAVMVFNQLNFINSKNLGYNKEHVLYFSMQGDFLDNYRAIKNELKQNRSIIDVTAGRPPVRHFFPAFALNVNGKSLPPDIKMQSLPVDYNYIKTFGMQMLAGRDLSEKIPNGFILNESAVKMLDLENPLGAKLSFKTHDRRLKHNRFEDEIVGIVGDFHHGSMHGEISPLIIYNNPQILTTMCLRVNVANIPEVIGSLENLWNKYAADYAFEYHFVDETLDNYYRSEKRLGQLFAIFTALAIIVSSLGLFGLALFSAERRTTEIGIRKILGSSSAEIVLILSKEFVLLVILSNIIAWPIAYYAMNRWLENFAYRTTLSWQIFVLSGLAAVMIALATISFQALKAALANPVEAIKYE
jgi:putative ABC transport system permease protein